MGVMRSFRRGVVLAAAVSALATTSACDTDDGRILRDPVFPAPVQTTVPPTSIDLPVTEPLVLLAPWSDGDDIGPAWICTGLLPPLSWTGVPSGTTELVISLIDVDRPDVRPWVLFGIPPETSSLTDGELPAAAQSWPDDSGFVGPCPPVDETRRYAVTLYALNQQVEPTDEDDVLSLLDVLDSTALARSSVSGVVTR